MDFGLTTLCWIFLALGYLIGKFLPTHKHNYKTLYCKPITNLPVIIHANPINQVEAYIRDNGHLIDVDPSKVFITYSKCTICGKSILLVSNGSDRTFRYDSKHLKSLIDAQLTIEKEASDQALLNRVNEQIDLRKLGNQLKIL